MGGSCGFTLAEVLIVLGIIGLIADMTIPTLVNRVQKQIVEVRLLKFYTNMNQAIRMSEIENGPIKEWYQLNAPGDVDKIEGWFNTYLSKYLRTVKTSKTLSGGEHSSYNLYFSDGSMAGLYEPDGSNLLFIFQPKETTNPQYGKERFLFMLYANGMEPYGKGLDREYLMTKQQYACRIGNGSYCAAVIQLDGWIIKEDYPFFR